MQADSISKAYVIEKLIEKRKAVLKEQGHPADFIASHCFEDSPHVCHLQKYPVQYKEVAQTFLVGRGLLSQEDSLLKNDTLQ